MQKFATLFSKALSEKISAVYSVELSPEEIADMLEYPPDSKMGDVALPCFKLSRTLRTSPVQIASGLADGLEFPEASRIEAVSGYLNAFISDGYVITSTLKGLVDEGENIGRLTDGVGKTMCIDYSSPNMAKRFHIGHLGTTAIGNSIKRIYEFAGYKCYGINHLGDWGTQYGRLAVAYERWGSREEVERLGVKELERI